MVSVQKKKKKKTNKGKIIPRTTLDQRFRCVKMSKKDFKNTGKSRANLSNWKKQMPAICKLPIQDRRSKNYLLQKEDDTRKTGLFPKQQEKLKDDFAERRARGEAVSTVWLRMHMKFICNRDKPAGYDPQKHKFGDCWCNNFLDRKGLSVRRRTNKKKTSVFQRLHKINNYKYYTVFKLADDPISSSESESEESESESEDSEEEDVVTTASESESEDSS